MLRPRKPKKMKPEKTVPVRCLLGVAQDYLTTVCEAAVMYRDAGSERRIEQLKRALLFVQRCYGQAEFPQ